MIDVVQYSVSMEQGLLIRRFKRHFSPLLHSGRKLIIGVHPKTRIFHPQYLVNENLRAAIEKIFFIERSKKSDEQILDVGCGLKPYSYLSNEQNWYGIDIYAGPKVDLVINGTDKWDLKDNSFDAVLCTEVLEHAIDPDLVLDEIWRVLKPNGVAMITCPFIYGVHGEPNDFRRYTYFGLLKMADKFEVLDYGMLGGVGSSLAINFNNWISASLAKNIWINLALSPISWLIFSLVNFVAKGFDFIDKTNAFGTNSWISIRKSQ